MATLPPRRNLTPTKISKQHITLTPLQILLQMGFPKHRAEKALAATGNRDISLASDWLLAHVNDPLLDDSSPREYILYACPTGEFLEQLQTFWKKSHSLCGWNGAHNFTPHITLVSFFKAPDEDAPHLSQSLKSVMERHGAVLNEPLKLEIYTSPNFMGFFVAEEHADYLKRIAMQYVKEVSNATISLEPHVKSLHLTLAYQFPNSQYTNLKALVDELDPNSSAGWELRLYSRDPRVNGKQVHKVIHPYSPSENDELDLRSGDYVYISGEALANSPDSWVEGTSWLTGQSGLLPESYTERTAESDAWTLHRKVSLTNFNLPEKQHNQLQIERSINRSTQYSDTDAKEEEVEENGSEDQSHTITVRGETYEIPNKALYEEVGDLKDVRVIESPRPDNIRRIFLMRHGERVDFTFGMWIPYCFDDEGNYIRKDLNMPVRIPQRKSGPMGYLGDSPLTRVGVFQAVSVGEGLGEASTTITAAYSSPALRSIQTLDGVLRGMNLKDKIKIQIEPGLFEWLTWYHQNGIPNWLTHDELITAGFNIDTTYSPIVDFSQCKEARETCKEFYERSHLCMEKFLEANPVGNILVVGHASTLEVCSRGLIEMEPRKADEMTKIIQKIPYCGLAQLCYVDDKWELSEPPCPPITHGTNQRHDWKVILSQ